MTMKMTKIFAAMCAGCIAAVSVAVSDNSVSRADTEGWYSSYQKLIEPYASSESSAVDLFDMNSDHIPELFITTKENEIEKLYI